ncbi:MAG: response regulator [Acidobacteria bacterium]|nr:response regulator [Acidobacteriota bacterium]
MTRLLLVDDDARFGDYLRVMLGRSVPPVTVDVVGTVEAAQRELAGGRHHVCLLDYRLGEEDGLDVLRAARARGIRTPIVLLTGESDPALEFRALEEGATDYLNKADLAPARVEHALRRAVARRRADAALRERELRVADAENFALVMRATVGLDDRWLKVSPRLCDVLGYTEEELLRLPLIALIHPDDVEGCNEERRRLMDQHVRTVELDRRYVRKDGGIVWMYQNCSLVRVEDDIPCEMLVYFRDITAQKRLQEQLGQAQKMAAIGQLAGGVAHDFNNLLTAILGYAELLKDRLSDTPDICADVEEIRKAGVTAAALTEQLLVFSRKRLIRPEVLSLNAVVEGMRSLLQRLLGEDIALELALASDAPRIQADPVQIQQVLLNLATNAREAMPRGGRLTVQTSRVEAPAGRGPLPAGPCAVLTVRDSGVGMDAATRARIFEPFFTTKPAGGGSSGLGLATVYGIVQQSGGDITCDSAPGAGTTFTQTFPASAKGAVEAKAAAPRAVRPATGTILLVEDRDDVRALTRRVLERGGYGVVDTGDPLAARALIASRPIDLLLTDVVMPGLNGPDLARLIRADHPALPVIFMSGFPGHEALDDVADAPFVHKPFTPAALLAKVGELLSERSPAGGRP